MCKLEDKLYKKYPEQINEIVPLVPALWTGDPATPELAAIAGCFPDREAIRVRVNDLIQLLTAQKKNPTPLQHLILENRGGPNCQLVRDYLGEYAPCIAAVVGGGQCQIVDGRKPSSIKKTIEEVDTSKQKVIDLRGCPKDEADATDWLLQKVNGSTRAKPYKDAEAVKCKDLGKRLFGAADLSHTVDPIADPVSMNALHCYWLQNGIPRGFHSKVAEWKKKPHADAWADSIFQEAQARCVGPAEPKKAPQPHSVPVSEPSSVKANPPVTFALWIRAQPPKEHSHNMGQDLLEEIVAAISMICQHVYDKGTRYRFLLFGDRVETFADLPVHSGGDASKKKTPIPNYVADTFHDHWEGEPRPEVMVLDFRGFYETKGFQTPTLSDLANAEADGTFKPPSLKDLAQSDAKARDKAVAEYRQALQTFREQHPRKSNLSYWEQYWFFQAIDSRAHPRFIIGAESGNMDGFGYCGIPVISIDVDDKASTDESIVTDRIGQYSLLTPLWNLLNYHRGGDIGRFRQLLYGSILMYTRFAGELHASKWSKAASKAEPLPKFVDGDIAKLKVLSTTKAPSKNSVIEDSLKGTYHVINVDGDGNCLFRALSQARTSNQDRHLLYRQQAVDYAAATFQLEAINAAHEPNNFDLLTDYRDTLRLPATSAEDSLHWGSYLEIEAFALSYRVTVEVYSEDFEMLSANPNRPETVRIFYVDGNHYKAIRPKGH
jgi:hypothetical protein